MRLVAQEIPLDLSQLKGGEKFFLIKSEENIKTGLDLDVWYMKISAPIKDPGNEEKIFNAVDSGGNLVTIPDFCELDRSVVEFSQLNDGADHDAEEGELVDGLVHYTCPLRTAQTLKHRANRIEGVVKAKDESH